MIGPERGGGRGDADRKLGASSHGPHRLDLDGAEARGIGDRGAGHAGKDHRADDVDVAEAAAHPADQRDREIVDAAGDAGDVHQVAGEDEERHREQRKALDAGDHALRQRHVGRRAGRPGCRAATTAPSPAPPAGRAASGRRKPPSSSSMTLPFRSVVGAGTFQDRIALPPVFASPPAPSARTSARSRAARLVDKVLGQIDRGHGLVADDLDVDPDQLDGVAEERDPDQVDHASTARAPRDAADSGTAGRPGCAATAARTSTSR